MDAGSGQPNTWNPSNPGTDANLHVSVTNHTDDVGPAPTFEYHRFWAQTDITMAMSAYEELFGSTP
jgi:hypothetical protein